jgi:hypothetical protein
VVKVCVLKREAGKRLLVGGVKLPLALADRRDYRRATVSFADMRFQSMQGRLPVKVDDKTLRVFRTGWCLTVDV